MKTIKQIADELGVSKTAVRRRLTPEVQTKFAETVAGVIYISSDGESVIRQTFQRTEVQTGFPVGSANKFAVGSGEVSTLVSMLQRELDAKNQLIDRQQSTIDELTAALITAQQSAQAAQALHAGTMQQHLTDGRSPAPAGDSRRSWWRFWVRG